MAKIEFGWKSNSVRDTLVRILLFLSLFVVPLIVFFLAGMIARS